MKVGLATSKVFASKLVSATLIFAGTIIFGRLLGASGIGLFFLFETAIWLLGIPADFGIRTAVEKRISEGKTKNKIISSAILLKFTLIIFVVVFLTFIQHPVNNYFGEDLTSLLSLGLIIQEFNLLILFILRGEMRVDETATLSVVRNFIWLLGGIVIFSFGTGEMSIIYSYLIGHLVSGVWGAYKVNVQIARPTISHVQSLLDFAKYNLVSLVGGRLYDWLDIAIIGLFLSTSHVGAYEVAWRISTMFILMSEALTNVIFPQISEWEANGNINSIVEAVPDYIFISLILVIPGFAGAILLSQNILLTIYGPEFTMASLVLIVLVGEKVVQSMHKVIGHTLVAMDYPDKAALATIVSLTVNGLLNLILIWKYGILGAALATILSSGLNLLLHAAFLRTVISIKIPKREILVLIFASITMSIPVYLLKNIFKQQSIFGLTAIIIAGVATYVAVLYSDPQCRGVIKKFFLDL